MHSSPALFSVHDVMPETLDSVQRILDAFSLRGRRLPALLVVPGRYWEDEQIERLRDWEHDGAELVAHGWLHWTQPRRLYHQLHSRLLSRNVAEHLDLTADGVCELMNRSRQWFLDHDLQAPDTYIPPAWALGMPSQRLIKLPYTCVETLDGVYVRCGETFRKQKLPLLGFEADTPLRAAFLRRWNRRQEQRAARTAQTLRISIHPSDLDLLLGDELLNTLKGDWQDLAYGELTA